MQRSVPGIYVGIHSLAPTTDYLVCSEYLLAGLVAFVFSATLMT